jgi:group I intron endonuclease
MKSSGIYKIQSKSMPERTYVGSAINLRDRWWNHIGKLKSNTHGNAKLQNHFNKYGEEDFVFIIIEPCLPEFLTIREQYYIDTLKPFFNICKVAGSCLGVKRTVEFSKKSSERQKGKKLTEEHKRKLSEAAKNRPPITEITRNKLRELGKRNDWSRGNKNKLGKRISEEAKEKLRQSHLGRKQSEEAKAKRSESMRGHVTTEETKFKIGLANKGNSNWKYRKQSKIA